MSARKVIRKILHENEDDPYRFMIPYSDEDTRLLHSKNIEQIKSLDSIRPFRKVPLSVWAVSSRRPPDEMYLHIWEVGLEDEASHGEEAQPGYYWAVSNEQGKFIASGRLEQDADEEGTLVSTVAMVLPKYQRQGIFSQVISALTDLVGDIEPDTQQTRASYSAWEKMRREGSI